MLREIDRLSAIFSGYDAASEFSRWQSRTGTPAKVSPELFEVLQASDAWHTRSGGAFDPRVEAFRGSGRAVPGGLGCQPPRSPPARRL